MAIRHAHRRVPRASAADRGLVPPPSGDRRRADRGAADRARPAADRVDRAVVPAGRGPERPVAASLAVGAAVPAAVDGRGARPAYRRTPRRRSSFSERPRHDCSASCPRRRRRRTSARTSWPWTSGHISSRRSRTCRRTRRGCSTPTSPRRTATSAGCSSCSSGACPTQPWRLKCPTHLLFLPALDQSFPDARFVMTHRDPTEVMLSVADVYAEVATMFSDDIDLEYLGALNVEHWSVGMERALAFRDAGADARFYDIDFRAMQAIPIGEVRGLYDVARRAGHRGVRGRDAPVVARERRGPRAARAAGPRGIRPRPDGHPAAVRRLRDAHGAMDRTRGER